MIPLFLVGVVLDVSNNQPFVLLREEPPGRRHLPIAVGPPEAVAIAGPLQGVTMGRPMTHDLLKNVLEDMAARIDRVVITGIEQGTFVAELDLLEHGHHHRIPSRPSDAIALAVRYEDPVPIFAEEAVLQEAGVAVESDEDKEIEQFRQFLQGIEPQDFEA